MPLIQEYKIPKHMIQGNLISHCLTWKLKLSSSLLKNLKFPRIVGSRNSCNWMESNSIGEQRCWWWNPL